jgi:hypothetical protein
MMSFDSSENRPWLSARVYIGVTVSEGKLVKRVAPGEALPAIA